MNIKLKKIKPDIKTSLIVIIIVSLVTTGLMFYLSPGSLKVFMGFVIDSPSLFILNYLPILLLMLMLYFISGNCIFASGIPFMIFTAAAFANRTKSTLRQDPLVPSDLSVITEVKSILQNYDKIYMILAIAAVLITLAIIALAFLFFNLKYI